MKCIASLRRHSANLIMLVFLAVSVAMTIAHFLSWDLADKNWILMVAGMMEGGKTLYSDVVEVNMPAIFWIYQAAIKLSKGLGIEDYNALSVMVCALVAVSSCLCYGLLRAHPVVGTTPDAGYHSAILPLFILLLLVVPPYFGDREHLFMVLVLPYLLRFSPLLAQLRLSLLSRITMACMAGVAFCLKPHAIIFLVAVLATRLLHSRSLNACFTLEHVVLYCIGTTYLWAVYTLTPDYFHLMLPIAWAAYDSYQSRTSAYLLYYLAPVISLAVCMADFSFRGMSPLRKDIYYWLTLTAASVAYVQINNGWQYTFYPLYASVSMAIFFIWREYAWRAQQQNSSTSRHGINACRTVGVLGALYISVYAVSFAVSLSYGDIKAPNTQCASALAEVMRRHNVQSYGVISRFMVVWPVLTRHTGIIMQTRGSSWLAGKLIAEGTPDSQKVRWLADYFFESLNNDIGDNKPNILFVEFRGNEGKENSPVLNFLLGNEPFKKLFSRYIVLDVEGLPNVECPYKPFLLTGLGPY